MSSLLRYDPFKVLDEMNQLFGQQGLRQSDASTLETSQWNPHVDIHESATDFKIDAELPGVKKEHIDVSMEGNLLTIKGTKTNTVEEKSSKFHRTERSYGEFQRQFSLPETADLKNISAKFDDGVLALVIPKVEKQGAKTIEIK